MKYLVDTNVISEFVKTKPAASVIAWLARTEESSLFLSVLVLGEIRKGVEKLRPSKRKQALERWLQHDLPLRFAGRVVAVSDEIADTWGRLSADAEVHGGPLPVIDALIAATAIVGGMTIVTRNVNG